MFEHPHFDRYAFEDVPLNRDIYLCDEGDLAAYEAMMLGIFNRSGAYDPPGPVAGAAARHITDNSIELSWYPDVFKRFHEVLISLPKSEFRTAVGSWQWDEKPHIFVSSEWLTQIHLRSNAVFAQIDVANSAEPCWLVASPGRY
ncbi:MAG: hypothetical protein ACT4PZ_04460 [Panacagrimonas sp.]